MLVLKQIVSAKRLTALLRIKYNRSQRLCYRHAAGWRLIFVSVKDCMHGFH
jgi:hypothetical protein